MENKDFSIGEAYKFGWNTVWANKAAMGYFLMTFIVQIPPGIIQELTKKQYPLVSMLFGIGGTLLTYVVSIGLIKIALRYCDNEKPEFMELFEYWKLLPRFLGASIICALAVIGGFILLIVPGIIIGLRLSFYSYLLVDQDQGVMNSLKQSFALTKGYTGKLLVFMAVGVLINLLGLLCLIVGLLVSIPVTAIAFAYVYRNFFSMRIPSMIPQKAS